MASSPEIPKELVIENRDLPCDRSHLGFLACFWLLWIPATAACIYLAIRHEPVVWFWVLLGSFTLLVIPWMILQSRRTQKLIATETALVIHGATHSPFRNIETIPRDCELILHIGFVGDGDDSEGFLTLNLFYSHSPFGKFEPIPPRRSKRLIIAQFASLPDKRKLYSLVREFLLANQFKVTFEECD